MSDFHEYCDEQLSSIISSYDDDVRHQDLLLEACCDNDLDRLRTVLKYSPNPDRDFGFEAALRVLCEDDASNIALISIILTYNPYNINECFEIAVKNDALLKCQLLLAHGADINEGLVAAAKHDNVTVLNMLLTMGAVKVNTTFLAGCEHDSIDCVEILMSYEVELIDGFKTACKHNSTNVINTLFPLCINKDVDLSQCLLHAVANKNIGLCQSFLSSIQFTLPVMNQVFQQVCEVGFTAKPLFDLITTTYTNLDYNAATIMCMDARIGRRLIELGANDFVPVLHHACNKGCVNMVELALTSTTFTTNELTTGLRKIICSLERYTEPAIGLLLQYGADVYTPLGYGIRFPNVCETLINHGFNPTYVPEYIMILGTYYQKFRERHAKLHVCVCAFIIPDIANIIISF